MSYFRPERDLRSKWHDVSNVLKLSFPVECLECGPRPDVDVQQTGSYAGDDRFDRDVRPIGGMVSYIEWRTI